MGAAVRLHTDFGPGELRLPAKRAEDADQARRLLSLAAVLDEIGAIGGIGADFHAPFNSLFLLGRQFWAGLATLSAQGAKGEGAMPSTIASVDRPPNGPVGARGASVGPPRTRSDPSCRWYILVVSNARQAS